MNLIWEIIKYIVDLFFGIKRQNDQKEEEAQKQVDDTKRKAESIIDSKEEESRTSKQVDNVNEKQPKVNTDNGGLDFTDFNKKSKKAIKCIFLFLLFSSCCCNDERYVAERFPVYEIPDRPYLENISPEEINGVSRQTLEKIKKNYDLLIKWGESLEVIVVNYNEYAKKRNSLDPLYKRIK